MRKVLNYRVTRPIAGLMAGLCLLLWQAPPAAAFHAPRAKRLTNGRTQTPDAALRKKISAKENAAQLTDQSELTPTEMKELRGRGANRNSALCASMPWHRSLRDVNLNTGNLSKSYTDIQVPGARGAGLALQRTYNSNDDRIGPFGVGWTHVYDIHLAEGSNGSDRTDFFGGEHHYTRDADGLYSPPPYMFDELSSEYNQFLAEGPPSVLSDEERGQDGTVKHFFSNGGERSCDYIEDRHGNRTVFTYGLTINGRGVLTRVTDPSGRYLEFTWSNVGTSTLPAWRITQVQGPFDSSNQPIYTVTYEYNAEHNLWKVHQDPAGLNRTTTFAYTTVAGESGLLSSITDPAGNTVSYAFDLPSETINYTGTVRVTGITEPGSGGNHIWEITPSIPGAGAWPFAVTVSSNGGHYLYMTMHDRLTTAYYNVAGGAQYVTTYDLDYNVSSKIRSSLIYGPDSYYTTIPSIHSVYTYGPHGNVLTESLYGVSNSTTTTTYYHASKYFQRESVTDPNGNLTSFDYYSNSDPSPGNRGETKWVRDPRFLVTGEQFEYTYNQYGQKLTETNLNDVVTQYVYDDLWGNLTSTIQDVGSGHLNRTTSMTYDIAGRRIASTDPKGQTSTFTYNGVGQPLAASLPGESITYSYGANGRTEGVTDGRGTTQIAYESGNDRVQSVTDPVTGTISYSYGLAGQLMTKTLPGGGTWTYDYGAGGILGGVQQVLPNDDPNSLAFMVRNIEDDQGRLISYFSDTYGGLHEVRNNRSYNSSGALISYLDVQYQYDNHGWTTQTKNIWRALDSMGQWQSQVLIQNDYTYDNVGNRLTNQLSDHSGVIRTETYAYDALSRLTSVNYGDGTTQSYAFDAMGNRTSKVENGVSESYSYNNANMLISRGANAYTYDANGNNLTGAGRTNSWDSQNRLTQCVTASDTSNFVYSSDGLRRRATVNGTARDFVYDGQEIVRERSGGSNVATFLSGPRGPEYRRDDATSTVKWYLYDGLGSVLGELDASGNVTASRKYDVYGAERATTGTAASSHRFVGALGHSSDASTGLVYMRARYMDPVLGRFVSEDKARDGVNYFAYAASNPISAVDSDGQATDWLKLTGDLIKVAGAIGVLYAAACFNPSLKQLFDAWFPTFCLPTLYFLMGQTVGGETLMTGMAVVWQAMSIAATTDMAKNLASSTTIGGQIADFWKGYAAMMAISASLLWLEVEYTIR